MQNYIMSIYLKQRKKLFCFVSKHGNKKAEKLNILFTARSTQHYRSVSHSHTHTIAYKLRLN